MNLKVLFDPRGKSNDKINAIGFFSRVLHIILAVHFFIV